MRVCVCVHPSLGILKGMVSGHLSQIPKSVETPAPYINGIIFVYNLYTFFHILSFFDI
jgi:hypothetical protein